MTCARYRQIVIGLPGGVMKQVITLGAETTRIGRESRNRYLSHISSWQETVRRIVRERIDRGERLHLLRDASIEPDSGQIDHRWREGVAFLDTGGLTLRERPQKNAIERVGSGCLAIVEQVSRVDRIVVREAVIEARRDKILHRNVLCGESIRPGVTLDRSVGQGEEGEEWSHKRAYYDRSRNQLADACLRRGHRVYSSHSQPLANTLVIEEKEGSLAFDGTTQGSAELVTLKRRHRGAIKEVTRVQSAVAEKFIQRAMELVRSRTSDRVDDAPRGLSVVGGCVARDHGELLNCVHTEGDAEDTGGSPTGVVIHAHPIQPVTGLLGPRAADRHHGPKPTVSTRVAQRGSILGSNDGDLGLQSC